MRVQESWGKFALKCIAVALVYYGLARLGLVLATINNNASPVWPATGFAIGALVVFGPRYSLAIWLGAFAANLHTGSNLLCVLAIATGNMLEASLGQYLFWRGPRYIPKFQFQLDALICLGISFIAPVVSASMGMGALVLLGGVAVEGFRSGWITWYVGDVVGALVAIPVTLAVLTKEFQLKEVLRPKVLLAVSIAGILTWLIVGTPTGHNFIFAAFGLLLFSALAAGRVGLLLSLLVTSAVSIAVTAQGSGPFALGSVNDNLIFLQILLLCLGISALFIQSFTSLEMRAIPITTLLMGWVLSGFIFYSFRQAERSRDQEHFEALVEKAELQIQLGLQDYEDALRAGLGLWRASNSVERKEWADFTHSLKMSERYPGTQGLGIIFVVPKDAEDRFVAYQRRDKLNFKIKEVPNHLIQEPEPGNYKRRFVITYVEPETQNAPAIGLDIRSEKVRRLSAEQAMLTNEFSMTGRIRLVQGEADESGFLVFVPFYKKNVSVETAEDRRKFIEGFVYAPLITKHFLEGALNGIKSELALRMTDMDSIAGPSEFEKIGERLQSGFPKPVTRTLVLGQRNFQVEYYPGAGFVSSLDVNSAWAGAAAAIISLLLALVVSSLISVTYRAQKLAATMNDQVILQRAQLENSSKLSALGEMASGIAHEINNPLSIISGRAAQLRMLGEKGTLDSNKVIEVSRKIEDTVYRIARIIKGLRTFSRDASTDPMESLDMLRLLENSLEFCRERFRSFGVDLRFGELVNATVMGREPQLVQVLVNLLNNAFDAVEGLDEKWVEVSSEILEGQFVKIVVTDSGKGIDPKVAKRLMEPFFTTKGPGKGTGLGLSVSRGIISQHGGRLYLDTDSEHTRFVIELPTVKASSVNPTASESVSIA